MMLSHLIQTERKLRERFHQYYSPLSQAMSDNQKHGLSNEAIIAIVTLAIMVLIPAIGCMVKRIRRRPSHYSHGILPISRQDATISLGASGLAFSQRMPHVSVDRSLRNEIGEFFVFPLMALVSSRSPPDEQHS